MPRCGLPTSSTRAAAVCRLLPSADRALKLQCQPHAVPARLFGRLGERDLHAIDWRWVGRIVNPSDIRCHDQRANAQFVAKPQPPGKMVPMLSPSVALAV